MQPLPRIPGYELLSFLGGSTLTSVYSAQCRGDDVPCAVKVLNRDRQENATAVKLFQREVRASLAVRHPHLVNVLEVQVDRPPYFLVMELLGGESLRRFLRREYCLEVVRALWIARQTAEALAALHAAGFVHGDFKPDNIRIVQDGRAILLDLGFAHRVGENNHLLQEGYVLGTVNYLAPELCGSEPQDGFKTDVFSLGVTLFETLTGQMPYPSGSIEQTFRRHEADPPAQLSRLLAGKVGGSLRQLVGKLLSRLPEDRPSAQAVVQQLVAMEIAAIGRRRAA